MAENCESKKETDFSYLCAAIFNAATEHNMTMASLKGNLQYIINECDSWIKVSKTDLIYPGNQI